MQPKDVDSAMKLSTAEGWNQTVEDWKLFIETPGNICLVAEAGDKIIGTTTAINYANKVAWIAMVLVDREYRGRGVSKALLETVLEKLHYCECIKLDATPAGQLVYKNFGFLDEYRIARMTNLEIIDLPPKNISGRVATQTQLADIPQLVAFDEVVFGANRDTLMRSLLQRYPGKAWTLKQDNTLAGIALGRRGYKYHHIGPVFASGTTGAKQLITEALHTLIHEPVVVDVLCDKEELIEWLRSIGFVKQREFIRMYKNKNPFPGSIGKQFLICGPEFG